MKKLRWLGNSKKNLVNFPNSVVQEVGYALYYAQKGDHYHKTKPFKGCGSGVYEIVVQHEKNAYRALYVVNIGDTVYVLHCFQKKSKRGIKTPHEEVEIIKQRLKLLRAELTKR